jgi:hypothetical protein
MCNLRCVFCQNWDISQKKNGWELDGKEIADLMLKLQNETKYVILSIFLLVVDVGTLIITDKLEVLHPRRWRTCRPNHLLYRKFYFTDFVQNSLHMNMGMIIFDLHAYLWRLLEAKHTLELVTGTLL